MSLILCKAEKAHENFNACGVGLEPIQHITEFVTRSRSI